MNPIGVAIAGLLIASAIALAAAAWTASTGGCGGVGGGGRDGRDGFAGFVGFAPVRAVPRRPRPLRRRLATRCSLAANRNPPAAVTNWGRCTTWMPPCEVPRDDHALCMGA